MLLTPMQEGVRKKRMELIEKERKQREQVRRAAMCPLTSDLSLWSMCPLTCLCHMSFFRCSC